MSGSSMPRSSPAVAMVRLVRCFDGRVEFEEATAVTGAGPGRYRAVVDDSWRVLRGPNGGYLAAVVLRALTQEVADPRRSPRSLTLHYLAPPEPGPVEVTVVVERAGRSLATLSA